MTDIYQDHQKAFKHVAAYVVTDKAGERVATVAFKYAASGLRTTCYFHVLGARMVKAYASGGGYDKASAAAHAALAKANAQLGERHLPTAKLVTAFAAAIKDEGHHWDDDLRAAGFNVLQAV